MNSLALKRSSFTQFSGVEFKAGRDFCVMEPAFLRDHLRDCLLHNYRSGLIKTDESRRRLYEALATIVTRKSRVYALFKRFKVEKLSLEREQGMPTIRD